MIRALIVAALGWMALVGGSPVPSNNAQSDQVARERPVSQQSASTAPDNSKQDAASRADGGCERGEDNRQSDLCAQWKAADAAYDAALSAKAQIVIGYVGLFLGAITMFAAIAAALYARRAAVATEETVGIARDASVGAEAALAIAERNADATARHVEVALQTSYAQLRPWLKLDVKGSVFRSGEDDETAVIYVAITNGGVSPAVQAGVSARVRLICWTGDAGPIDLPTNLGMLAPIFPNDPSLPHECSYQLKQTEILAVTEEAWRIGAMPAIVFDFKISYRAVFSDEVKDTAFRFIISGVPGDVEWLARDHEVNKFVPCFMMRQQGQDIMT